LNTVFRVHDSIGLMVRHLGFPISAYIGHHSTKYYVPLSWAALGNKIFALGILILLYLQSEFNVRYLEVPSLAHIWQKYTLRQ